jgi:hypothetical protein
VDVNAELDTPASARTLFAWVEDLGAYPRWLDIVARAQPTEGVASDPGPAWLIDLRGRLGPLARTKRLRMVRSVHDEDTAVTFERRELDGRQHSPWVLRATIVDDGELRHLTMHLHYGGGLFGSVLERLLRDEISRSRDRLRSLVDAGPPS